MSFSGVPDRGRAGTAAHGCRGVRARAAGSGELSGDTAVALRHARAGAAGPPGAPAYRGTTVTGARRAAPGVPAAVRRQRSPGAGRGR
jgi:hypothetical protein